MRSLYFVPREGSRWVQGLVGEKQGDLTSLKKLEMLKLEVLLSQGQNAVNDITACRGLAGVGAAVPFHMNIFCKFYGRNKWRRGHVFLQGFFLFWQQRCRLASLSALTCMTKYLLEHYTELILDFC